MVTAVDQELRAVDEERLAADLQLTELDAAEASLPSSDAVTTARAERDRAAIVASERKATAER